MNPVIGVSYTKLTNLYKSVRKQNSTSNPFRLCVHQSQVLVETVEYRWNNFTHYFTLEGVTIFSPSHCFSWTVFNSENGLQPFVSHCDNPKFTPFDQRTSLAYILILCEGSGWGSMEIRGLVKILTVG